jgi:hypothetical protein
MITIDETLDTIMQMDFSTREILLEICRNVKLKIDEKK